MCNKPTKEWFVDAPWGKIAMMSWGNPDKPPILLVHGYLDTAATFTFLVDKLPDDYYYVGIDTPGHGKSEPFPPGIHLTMLDIVQALRVAVEYMNWESFTFISHSIACILGLCYNHIYPGQIERMVLLDPKPGFAGFYLMEYHPDYWYKQNYYMYYDNYQKLNFEKPKSRTLESWISSVSRTRKLTEEQSKIILSRSLIQTGDNKYILSWEPRCKVIAQLNVPIETLLTIMTRNPLPTLIINASHYTDFVNVKHSKNTAGNILDYCEKQTSRFRQVNLEGHHDFHIQNPEQIARYIEDFLSSDENMNTHKKSKL